jgi:serine/threonine-protein kinase
MSPEQCKDSADVDLRSDIYSFGVIIYEALAGRTPFVAATGTEMLVMHLTVPPPPLRLEDVPAHLEAAVMRALAKERVDRFDSVAAFVRALNGEVVVTEVGSAQHAIAGTTAATDAADAGRMATAPAVTTFSRATGEVGTLADEEAPLALARTRRWPFVALGGLVGAGLALFLLVRPSHVPAPPSAPGAAGLAPPAARALAAPAPVALAAPDAGAATAPAATAQPRRERPATAPGAARTASATKPSPATEEHRRPVSKKRSAEDDWILH